VEVPVVERDPCVGAPLCARLVSLLVGRLAYPSNFTTWGEELNLEEEEL